MFKKLEDLFDKRFANDKYSILFNSKTGLQIIKGINGHEDPFALEMPSLLDIGIMGTCENTCKFCYQGHTNKPNMLLEDFKKIIDEVKHHTNQVALGGRGDPNKHENFKEILEYCRENKVVPNYTTSGVSLTEEEIRLSQLCGAVAVSDYGEDYTYSAINNLIAAGIKTNIHFMFTRQSYKKMMRLLSSKNIWGSKIQIKKVNAIIFLLFKARGAGKHIYSMIPTEDQIKSVSEMMFNKTCKFKIGVDTCTVNRVIEHVTLNKLQRMTIFPCEGAKKSAYISPDMKLMPCSFADHVLWGNAITEESSISDIWKESRQFKNFRNVLEKCETCCPAILY